MVSFVNVLVDKAVMVSINTHLCLFIVDIWNDFQKGSESTLILVYYQTLPVSPSSSDIVDLCTNLWCNNFREILFLGMVAVFILTFIFFNRKCMISVRANR